MLVRVVLVLAVSAASWSCSCPPRESTFDTAYFNAHNTGGDIPPGFILGSSSSAPTDADGYFEEWSEPPYWKTVVHEFTMPGSGGCDIPPGGIVGTMSAKHPTSTDSVWYQGTAELSPPLASHMMIRIKGTIPDNWAEHWTKPKVPRVPRSYVIRTEIPFK